MKTVYFDCFSGISGDMILGAFLDLGVPLAALQEELSKLKLSGYRLEVSKVVKNGLSGTRVNVLTEREHRHRNLEDIKEIISRSDLSPPVKTLSINVFQRLAEAEAKVHAAPVDKVHFHEVGALDAIIDVVGAAICLEKLQVEKVYCSKLNVGSGFARCRHGIIPVPAPAALELLRGKPVYAFGPEKELVTPTGAAIITTVCCDFSPLPEIILEKVGYGAGSMDLEIPNFLRILLGKLLLGKEEKVKRHGCKPSGEAAVGV